MVRYHATSAVIMGLLGLMAVPMTGLAQTPADLERMSLEDLMEIEITSASRKDQRAWDVAGAVFVINQDEIRRSGMTTIPDLLRLVPGANVAQINANKWAVSVRGFNDLYANKLLVLVDGRSVYNRIFSGVPWDAMDLMVDDIDRIEVVRGPGAALWGANAVNGVVNIVSKAAADTQGGLVRADVGSGQQGAMRYGGIVGRTMYRVYAQWTDRNESRIAGARADDASRSLATGFRVERGSGPNATLLTGGVTAGQAHALYTNLDPRTSPQEPISRDRSDALSGHLLGRWTHTREGGDSLQVQAFIDRTSRQEPVGDYSRHAYDIDAHYHTALGTRHDLVVGAGYRYVGERLDAGAGLLLTPADEHSSLLTSFVQDEIAFGDRLHVTLGSQVQYHSGVGAGVQPTARVMWSPQPRHRLWGAVSRALRTPSLADRGIRVDYPPVTSESGLPLYVTALGNPDAKDEAFVDAEAGYRVEIGTVAVIDVTGFVGRYSNLVTTEPAAPVVQLEPSPQISVTSRFGNQLTATTRGLEVAGRWTLRPGLQVDGSYSVFHLSPSLAPESLDPTAASEDGSAPRAQWQLRTAYAPSSRAMVNLGVFHVGPIEQLGIAGYTRTDLSAEWRLNSRLSLMAIGQNLLSETHTEFSGIGALVLATEVPRSGSLRLRWTFQ